MITSIEKNDESKINITLVPETLEEASLLAFLSLNSVKKSP